MLWMCSVVLVLHGSRGCVSRFPECHGCVAWIWDALDVLHGFGMPGGLVYISYSLSHIDLHKMWPI